MDSSRDSEFDTRLGRMESAVAALERSIDALISERRQGSTVELRVPSQDQMRSSPVAGGGAASPAVSLRGVPSAARPRSNTASENVGRASSWFASRNPEWWLSRVGMGFLILGILLLYAYAIDRGWLTPAIRVFAGLTTGGVLLWAARRVRTPIETNRTSDFGFRELLLGGALAVWYLTAYAASVWYQLIPIPAARLAFFVLGIVSGWIALKERREIFALLAVVTGFATPFILPAPVQSMTELSLYLGAVVTMGLIVYLMRGWQSIVWITVLGFWASVATQTGSLGS